MRRRCCAVGVSTGWSDQATNKFALARDLRARLTPAEKALWALLRGRSLGVKFRRQHPIDGFIVDFFCTELGLVIELDGPVHAAQIADDLHREEALTARGLIIVRFDNAEVLDAPERVLAQLDNLIAPLRPRAAPSAR